MWPLTCRTGTTSPSRCGSEATTAGSTPSRRGSSRTHRFGRLLEVLTDERGRSIEAPHFPKPPASEGLLLPRFDNGRLRGPLGIVEDDRRARRETLGQQRIR